MYRDGRGATKDEAQAVIWFRKAADQKNADAQNSLAQMYMFGRGVAPDLDQANYWYHMAADQGHRGAKQALEKMNPEDFKRLEKLIKEMKDKQNGATP